MTDNETRALLEALPSRVWSHVFHEMLSAGQDEAHAMARADVVRMETEKSMDAIIGQARRADRPEARVAMEGTDWEAVAQTLAVRFRMTADEFNKVQDEFPAPRPPEPDRTAALCKWESCPFPDQPDHDFHVGGYGHPFTS